MGVDDKENKIKKNDGVYCMYCIDMDVLAARQPAAVRQRKRISYSRITANLETATRNENHTGVWSQAC